MALGYADTPQLTAINKHTVTAVVDVNVVQNDFMCNFLNPLITYYEITMALFYGCHYCRMDRRAQSSQHKVKNKTMTSNTANTKCTGEI